MKGIIPQGKPWTRAAFAAPSDPRVGVLIPFLHFAHSEMEPSRWFRSSRSLTNKNTTTIKKSRIYSRTCAKSCDEKRYNRQFFIKKEGLKKISMIYASPQTASVKHLLS